MKVLHIHFWSDIRNSGGSVEKVIMELAKHGHKYENIVACFSKVGSRDLPGKGLSCIFDGVNIFSFCESLFLNRIFNKILGLGVFSYPELVEIIERERPDVLHFHNRQELVDKVVAKLSYRPSVVVHYHRNFENPVFPKRAGRLVCVSRSSMEYMIAHGAPADRCRVVNNSVSYVKDLPALQRKGKGVQILFGGGGGGNKGGQLVVDAVLNLCIADIKLHLAGNNLNRLVFPSESPKVIVHGYLPSLEFLKLLSSCDIVIVPSRDETFCLIGLEAMAMGKILISSGVGGLGEYVTADNSIILPEISTNSIAGAIKKAVDLLLDASATQHIIRNARMKAEAYSSLKVSETMEQVYDEAIAIGQR